MTKEELVAKMAGDARITKVQARASLESFMDAVKKSVKKGDRLGLVGFGTFSQSRRKARTGRNPKTGAEITIAARKAVRFKAGRNFSDFVNGNKNGK